MADSQEAVLTKPWSSVTRPVLPSSLLISMPAGPSVADFSVSGRLPPGCSSETSDMGGPPEKSRRSAEGHSVVRCRRADWCGRLVAGPGRGTERNRYSSNGPAGVVDHRPLIVTLLLDDAAQQRFDALRTAHFPAERNHLAAHVTLFHALPGEQER